MKKGLTLLEIIISVLILSLLMLGLANIFISGKRYLLHARARMAGGELGRHFIDPLQMDVRQDTWDSPGNNLTVIQPPFIVQTQTLNSITYNSTYNITNITGTDLRRVVVNINWNEPAP